MQITAEVQNVHKVMEQLAAFGKVKVRAAFSKGARAGCKIIAAKMKELVPADKGILKAAIKVRALPRSRQRFGAMVTTQVEGTKAFYAGFVDLGHKTRSGSQVVGMRYMKRAAEQSEGTAMSALLSVMQQELAKL